MLLLLYDFAFKNIDNHLKLNISMYYPTILIHARSDTSDPHNIRHPKSSHRNRIRVISDSLRIRRCGCGKYIIRSGTIHP
jgi:hypothetical protein